MLRKQVQYNSDEVANLFAKAKERDTNSQSLFASPLGTIRMHRAFSGLHIIGSDT